MIQELASYERALHEVLATEESLFNTLSFPTSTDEKVRSKPGAAKTLLVIPRSDSSSVGVSEASNVAQQVAGELEVETSDNSGPPSSDTRTQQKEQVAGMALFFNNYSTWLGKPGIFLEDLFVRPAFRKKGYGKALLQALARECVAKDYGRLEWNVLKWNKPSIDFYESDTIGAVSTREEWEGMRVTGDKLVKLAGSGTS